MGLRGVWGGRGLGFREFRGFVVYGLRGFRD